MPDPSASSGDAALRRAWLDARGVADLPIPVHADLRLDTWDDTTGAFTITMHVGAGAVLVRRRRSDQPWPEVDELPHEHSSRWSDPRWDWCFAAEFAISDEQLALLKVRLATTT